MQGVRSLDFMGINADPIDTMAVILPTVVILLTLSWVGRRRQIQS